MNSNITYRFSPIGTHQSFIAVLNYIARNATELSKVVVDKALTLDTLTVFSHDDEEYKFLEALVKGYGPESTLTHGLTLYIESDFEVLGHHIKYLGVRQPDATRPQVGYADFHVSDYALLQDALTHNQFVHELQSGRGQSMLELRHPNFDVLGYIVKAENHR